MVLLISGIGLDGWISGWGWSIEHLMVLIIIVLKETCPRKILSSRIPCLWKHSFWTIDGLDIWVSISASGWRKHYLYKRSADQLQEGSFSKIISIASPMHNLFKKFEWIFLKVSFVAFSKRTPWGSSLSGFDHIKIVGLCLSEWSFSCNA